MHAQWGGTPFKSRAALALAADGSIVTADITREREWERRMTPKEVFYGETRNIFVHTNTTSRKGTGGENTQAEGEGGDIVVKPDGKVDGERR